MTQTANDVRLEMLRELYEAIYGEQPSASPKSPVEVWDELIELVRVIFK